MNLMHYINKLSFSKNTINLLLKTLIYILEKVSNTAYHHVQPEMKKWL